MDIELDWTLLPAVVVRNAGFPWELVLSLVHPRAAETAAQVVRLERQALGLLAEAPDRGADARPSGAPDGRAGGGRLPRGVRSRLRDLRPLPDDTPGPDGWLAAWNDVTGRLEEARLTLDGLAAGDAALARAAVAGIIADERFLDALVCSAPGLYRDLRHGAKGGRTRRQLAELVQRLSASCETSGCYGPIGYGAVTPGRDGGYTWAGAHVCPRRVAYPAAPVGEALQQRLLADPALVAGLVPRRRTWTGETPDGAAFAGDCDGRRTLAEIAAQTGAGLERASAALAVAVRRGLLTHDLCPPATVCDPLGWLRERLADRGVPVTPGAGGGWPGRAPAGGGAPHGRGGAMGSCECGCAEARGRAGRGFTDAAQPTGPAGGGFAGGSEPVGRAGGGLPDGAETVGRAGRGFADGAGSAGPAGDGFAGGAESVRRAESGFPDGAEAGGPANGAEPGRRAGGGFADGAEAVGSAGGGGLVPGARERGAAARAGVPAQRARALVGPRPSQDAGLPLGRRVGEISELLGQYPAASPDVKLAVQRRIEALAGGGRHDDRAIVHEAAAGTLRVTVGDALAADLRGRVPAVLDLLAEEAELTRLRTNRLLAGRLGPGTYALAEVLRTSGDLETEYGDRLAGRIAALVRDAPAGASELNLAGRLGEPAPPAAPVLCSAGVMVAAPTLEAYEPGVTPLVLNRLHDTVLLTPWALQFHEEGVKCLAARDAEISRALAGFTVLNVISRRTDGVPSLELPGPVLELGGVAADPRRRRIGLDELYVHSDGQRAVLHAKGMEEPLLLHNGEHGMALHTAFALPGIRLPRLPDLPHVPRLTWDNVVISRRRWWLGRASFDTLGQAERDRDLLVAMARLRAAYELPVAFFASSPRERRSLYVDTRSPALLEGLARMAATADGVTLTEVLPGPGECWLRDGQQRFAAELSCVYVRPAGGGRPEVREGVPAGRRRPAGRSGASASPGDGTTQAGLAAARPGGGGGPDGPVPALGPHTDGPGGCADAPIVRADGPVGGPDEPVVRADGLGGRAGETGGRALFVEPGAMRSGRAAPGSPAVRRHGPVRWPDLPVQQFYGPLQQVHGPAPRGLDRQPRLSVPRADDGRARPAHPYPWPGERG